MRGFVTNTFNIPNNAAGLDNLSFFLHNSILEMIVLE